MIPSLIFHFFKKSAVFDIGYTEPEYAAAAIVKLPFAIMAAAKEIVSPIDNSTGKIYFFSYTAFAYIDQQSEKLLALV